MTDTRALFAAFLAARTTSGSRPLLALRLACHDLRRIQSADLSKLSEEDQTLVMEMLGLSATPTETLPDAAT